MKTMQASTVVAILLVVCLTIFSVAVANPTPEMTPRSTDYAIPMPQVVTPEEQVSRLGSGTEDLVFELSTACGPVTLTHCYQACVKAKFRKPGSIISQVTCEIDDQGTARCGCKIVDGRLVA